MNVCSPPSSHPPSPQLPPSFSGLTSIGGRSIIGEQVACWHFTGQWSLIMSSSAISGLDFAGQPKQQNPNTAARHLAYCQSSSLKDLAKALWLSIDGHCQARHGQYTILFPLSIACGQYTILFPLSTALRTIHHIVSSFHSLRTIHHIVSAFHSLRTIHHIVSSFHSLADNTPYCFLFPQPCGQYTILCPLSTALRTTHSFPGSDGPHVMTFLSD